MKVTKSVALEEPESDVTPFPESPRKLTFRENVLYMIAILGAMGLIGAALWGISSLVSSK